MRKKMEENNSIVEVDSDVKPFSLDDSDTLTTVPVELPKSEPRYEEPRVTAKHTNTKEKPLVNCLRNTKVTVRFIARPRGLITDPKHILYGGMADGAIRVFVTPRLSSGKYVNVLTDEEKAYLEDLMGLEENALSIYKKVNNFWDDSNELGLSRVRLTKHDTRLDLSVPEDYIKYKILLANKDFIAPSLQAMQDHPKATYQFVLIEEGTENKIAVDRMSRTMRCYKEYGKVENDKDILRIIIETIDGRPVDSNTKLEFMQTKINDMIQADSKLFLKIITDELLPTKVIIRKAIDAGFIAKKGNFLYLKSDNSPLCENGEDPTFNNAAKYLNTPKRQDVLFALEAKLK